MCTFDETTGKIYPEDDIVCAAVYALLGRRDWSKEPGNADITGDVMYTGSTIGRDQGGEVDRVAVRVDFCHLNPEQEGNGVVALLVRQGRHDFEVRVIVRIPSALVAARRQDEATLHWLEGMCTGLFPSCRHDARTQARPSVQRQRRLCPRLTQARRPADVSIALKYKGKDFMVLQSESLHSKGDYTLEFAKFFNEGEKIPINFSRFTRFDIFRTNGRTPLQATVPVNKKSAFLAKSVKMVNVKATIHPAFHYDNFANLTSTEARTPLYEHAVNLVLWVSPLVATGPVAPPGFPYILARGSISRVGAMNGRLTSERAAIALSLMDTVAVNRTIYAGKMRGRMGDNVNNHEEKEWDKELRLWWTANTTTALKGIDMASNAVVPFNTPAKQQTFQRSCGRSMLAPETCGHSILVHMREYPLKQTGTLPSSG